MPKHCANMRCPEQGPVQASHCGRIKRQTTIEFAIFETSTCLPFGDPDQAQPPVSSLLPAAASNLRSQPLPQPQCCHQAYLFSCVCRRLPSINVNSFLSKLSMAASKATCCVVRCVTEKREKREEAGRENASGEMKTYEQTICLYLMRLI